MTYTRVGGAHAARWERARKSFGAYWEMQLDLVDGGGEDEAAGGPATGLSGALPGTSKARTGGARPLGVAGHNLVPITPDMKQLFLQEELQRYAKPTQFFTYTGNDGRRVLVAPLKCAWCPPPEHLSLSACLVHMYCPIKRPETEPQARLLDARVGSGRARSPCPSASPSDRLQPPSASACVLLVCARLPTAVPRPPHTLAISVRERAGRCPPRADRASTTC